MLEIKSKNVIVNTNQEHVYNYLMDLNNFENLLPRDSISNFKSDTKSCSFKVTGGYAIGLEYKESSEFNKIILKSSESSPFPFTLDIFIDEKDGKVDAHQVVNADVNTFLKMVIEKPLRSLFDYIADRLVKVFAQK